jgi:hypothetical protein
MHRLSLPQGNVKAIRCSNCSGCQECRQPVPLVIPEGTGGSGCSAAVAAMAETLRASLPCITQRGQDGGGNSSTAPTSSTASQSAAVHTSDRNNSALVECAVCHRKPGDPGIPATLKLCGGCQAVRYCSAECQRQDWKMGHKVFCDRLRARRKEADTLKR